MLNDICLLHTLCRGFDGELEENNFQSEHLSPWQKIWAALPTKLTSVYKNTEKIISEKFH